MVQDSPALGGAEEYTVALVRHLVAQGDDVRCVVSLPAAADALREAGARVATFGGFGEWIATWSSLFAFRARRPLHVARWRRRLRAERPDAIYVTGLPEKLVITPAAAAEGIPVFWMEFAPMTPLLAHARGLVVRWYRAQAHVPRTVFTISEHSLEALVRDGLHPRERLTLAGAGTDPPSAEREAQARRDGAALRERLGIDGPVVGSLSRLVPEKGQRTLVRALAHVPGATLLIGGEGPDREALEAVAREAGVADRVHLLGYVGDKWALLAAADVFVFPSEWEMEGFGLVMTEAASIGKPVIGSDLGPLPEVIEHGITGLVVAPGDPDALGAAIAELLADPERAQTMGEAGRRRTREHFTATAVGERTRAALLEHLR